MRILLFTLTLCLFVSCRQEEQNVLPSELNKELRESLGTQIKDAILANEENLLVTCPIHDSVLYPYIQTLYNQATNRIRLDRHAPSTDRWNSNHTWEVFILDDEFKNIFILPGGDLFITTGLLKSLKYENELYYLMTYEALLMNEHYLFDELITLFNTNSLYNLANHKECKIATIEDLATLIPHIEFDAEKTMIVDELTAQEICATSIMDRFGINNILDYATGNPKWIWLEYRKHYSNRREYVRNANDGARCGEFVSNGNYQTKVLDILQ